jgi:hypothetical protein
VSRTFASALWALDATFELVRAGIDGVNIHTFPGAGYELFSFARSASGWRGSVSPEYYGLLMFAQSAPAGSVLLPVAGDTDSSLRVWALRAVDGRTRVVVINKDAESDRSVSLKMPGITGPAALVRLQAPSATAGSGIVLGGSSIDPRTGLLGHGVGRSLAPADGRYVLAMPAASAALLTFGLRR